MCRPAVRRLDAPGWEILFGFDVRKHLLLQLKAARQEDIHVRLHDRVIFVRQRHMVGFVYIYSNLRVFGKRPAIEKFDLGRVYRMTAIRNLADVRAANIPSVRIAVNRCNHLFRADDLNAQIGRGKPRRGSGIVLRSFET